MIRKVGMLSERRSESVWKPAILIPDGVGVRNFVLGGLLEELVSRGQPEIFHRIPQTYLPEIQSLAPAGCQWHSLVSYHESAFTFLLRNSLFYAQIHWVDSPHMRLRLRRPIPGSIRYRAGMQFAKQVGAFSAGPGRMKCLESLHQSTARRNSAVNHYLQAWKESRPDIVFATHQRPKEVIPPVLAARQLGIPTATFIFSWDNLSSKGRIAAPFDYFLVWSEHMKRELLTHYPDVTADRVAVVGSPQFDAYGEEERIVSRAEFMKSLGLDPTRKLICYSAGDQFNGAEDCHHLSVLLTGIRSGKIHGQPQVVLRPTPVDVSDRFTALLESFPELKVARPAWHHRPGADWSQAVPRPEDLTFLANLTRHSDLNVNFGSTMTLDFALNDTPVINSVMDSVTPYPLGAPLYDYLRQMDHYQPVFLTGAARFARTADELIQQVNLYLASPELDRDGRSEFCRLELGVEPGFSSHRTARALEILSKPVASVN